MDTVMEITKKLAGICVDANCLDIIFKTLLMGSSGEVTLKNVWLWQKYMLQIRRSIDSVYKAVFNWSAIRHVVDTKKEALDDAQRIESYEALLKIEKAMQEAEEYSDAIRGIADVILGTKTDVTNIPTLMNIGNLANSAAEDLQSVSDQLYNWMNWSVGMVPSEVSTDDD